jgi:hypothetical protein
VASAALSDPTQSDPALPKTTDQSPTGFAAGQGDGSGAQPVQRGTVLIIRRVVNSA